MMFKRALSSIGVGISHSSSPPKAKRARYVVDNAHVRSSHRARDASFNSFDASSSKNSSRNFLSDRTRSHYKNQTRHTPQTRMLGHSKQHRRHSNDSYDTYYDAHNTLNITTRNRRRNANTRYNVGGDDEYKVAAADNSRQNKRYRQLESKRMRKLWTDFQGNNEYILNKLEFCADTSFFITSNSIAHKISQTIKHLLSAYFSIANDATIHILDGLSCIGGNSY